MKDRERNDKKISWLWPGLIGMALGILLILSLNGKFFETEAEKAAPPLQLAESAKADDDNRESEVTAAVKKAKDSVVSVANFQGGNIWEGNTVAKAGSGSGVIYKKDGSKALVVTNHHVIEGASQLEITLNNGNKLPAELLGSDPLTDMAVLSVDASEIEDVIELGDSENLLPGASAIAIGNPLGFLEGTVTKGVISASERTMPVDIDQNGAVDWQTEVIQTDASINPGNSGGALIDINGELIGINSSKIAQDAVEGIGFAIPIHVALPVLEDLEQHGEVRRPYLGVGPVSLQDIPSQYWEETLRLPGNVTEGVIIMEVSPGSPAAEAGLQKLDVIVEIEGKKIKTVPDLRSFLYKDAKSGDTIDITFYRGGDKQEVKVTLENGN
ncbi:S1C family serine protease [Bacillus sp. EB01]|uniref:S1C family serine protease n=1 Tax=Bacillus sp. EB01 TaxID=1347086 RepID=UPI0005C5C85F|nr:trypsin-like peptidase domain-containing protein [Bacillus sp. EB01]